MRSIAISVRYPTVLLLCAITFFAGSGCRRESSPDSPVPSEQARSEEPAEQATPGALPDPTPSPETTPDDVLPTATFEPPPTATVTILSTTPIPEGGFDGEFGFSTLVQGGIIGSDEDETVTNATPIGKRFERTGRGKSKSHPLQGIEQDLVAKWNAIESLKSKMETRFHHKTDEHEITTEGMGTRYCQKKDGKLLISSIFGNAITVVVETEDPPTRQTGQRVKKVYDGEFLYIQTETHEGTTATKQFASPRSFMAVGGPGLIVMLRSLRKLQRAADTKIGERSLYVFTGFNPVTVKIEYMIDKETGLLHSIKREWRDSDRTRSLTFAKHEINTSLTDAHFTFTPDEGVVVVDRTRPATAPSPTVPQP